jgi:hypothetical protein
MTKRRLIFAVVVLAVAVALGGVALWVEHRRVAESAAMTVDIGG